MVSYQRGTPLYDGTGCLRGSTISGNTWFRGSHHLALSDKIWSHHHEFQKTELRYKSSVRLRLIFLSFFDSLSLSPPPSLPRFLSLTHCLGRRQRGTRRPGTRSGARCSRAATSAISATLRPRCARDLLGRCERPVLISYGN